MLRAAVLATCVLGALLFLRSRHAVVHAPARPGRAGSEWRPAVSSFAATTRRDPVPQPVADLLHSLDAARPAAAATPAAHAFASPRIGCARGGRRPTGPRPASGWKRTLSPEVYARAEFFGHERTLPEVFCDVGIGGVVWLSFSNTAFSELALNWISHVYRLRKERQFAMAALDDPFQRLLLGEGVPYFAFDHGVLGDMRSNVSGFRRLGALKGELVLRVLRAGRHVLLSDVDVVWLQDPEPHLRSLAAADVMSATDCLSPTADEHKAPRRQGVTRCAFNPGNADGHAAFNTGVLYFRATSAAKAVASAWRGALLSADNTKWLDDQLAFNELAWHGYRNHLPERAVRNVTADGRVILIRMGGVGSTAAVTVEKDEAWRSSAHDAGPIPPPSWRRGWDTLMGAPAEYGLEPGAEMPLTWTLAPLPARHFCSGHTFWEQQDMQPRGCASVHTTFVEGGNAGKLWRFREAGLWLLDPPEYYEPAAPAAARYLSFAPPEPPRGADLAPLRNASAPARKNDKYRAGWLVPAALNLSPRLAQQLELVRRHLLAMRDALALAHALQRTLILPRLQCVCDRSEAPSILEGCVYEGSDLAPPFTCPLTHIFDIAAFQRIRPPPSPAAADPSARPAAAPRGARVDFRESSFLANPLTPSGVAASRRTVRVARSAEEGRRLRAEGEAAIREGTSDAQAVADLRAHAETPLLHLESAEGVFGGWRSRGMRDDFEEMIGRSSLLLGSWCCSSWYKPSGSFDYATPPPTTRLPDACGAAGADDDAVPACRELQRRRRAAQRPFRFNYVPKTGKPGKDGYYELRPKHSGPIDEARWEWL